MTHRRNWVIASSRVGRGNLGMALELSEPEPWMLEGLCAQVDPDLWFPEKGCSTRAAKLICAGCPVKDECLEYAMERDERFGVYGGLSERDRRRYKATGLLPEVRKRKPVERKRPEHVVQRDAAVAAMTEAGIAVRAIAAELGITPRTVYVAQARNRAVAA